MDECRRRFDQALAHHRRGAIDAAAGLYRAVLASWPDHADSLHLLGVIEGEAGHLDQGIALIRRAIALMPAQPLYALNLTILLRRAQDPAAALAAARAGLIHAPDDRALLAEAAPLARAAGDPDLAIVLYRRLTRLAPDPAGLNALGNLLRAARRPHEAEACFRQALSLAPDHPAVLSNLAAALHEQGRLGEAITLAAQALARDPSRIEGWNNLGASLTAAGRFDEALEAFDRVLSRAPDDAAALDNRGVALAALGHWVLAESAHRRALVLRPDHGETRFKLAQVLLAQGRFAEGWSLYEARWQAAESAPAPCHPQPLWQGEPLEGRTILLEAEQGLGDTIQFCRYAPLVAARGGRVVLAVPPPLVRLMASLTGVAQVVAQGSALPAFDCHCPLMSLPHRLQTEVATIPATIPYLAADPERRAVWRDRLRSLGLAAGGSLTVGLVWAGNPRPDQPAAAALDRRRSLDPAVLAPLLAVPGVAFVSLQWGATAPPGVIDPMPGVRDLADTAAIAGALDLIISVDTALVHLAGALGRPVWLLNRFDHCWRWLDGAGPSPWYPTLEAFRQPRPGEWSAVITAVTHRLAALACGDRESNHS